ncbi:MAG TPA: alpha/beta fold hydrolase [Bacteroidales bacterium]|nr:alpha/beta fold hydrolase [Bacteroidales bacterium]
MKGLLSLFAILFITFSAYSQDIIGKWNGALKIQSTQLRLVFNIEKSGEGYKSTMDSPDQGATGIPCDETTFADNVLKIKINSIGASYEGVFRNDSIIGAFTQMGMKFSLDFSREEVEKQELKRPQEPKPPFPYYTEEVKFENKKDGNTLAGILTLPSKKGKYPVVVLISGSGPQNRDEELFGHKPFLVIADYLTRNGIGVLRYDDRGTAESTGDFNKATTFDLSNDAESAVEYLLTRKEVNKKKIGLMGHSEGGIIAPIVAARNKKVSFIVLLAGTGVRGDELLLMQQRAIAKASGAPESAVLENEKLNKPLFKQIINATDTVSLRTDLTEILKKSLDSNPMLKAQLTAEQMEQMVKETVNRLMSPWILYFIKHDPYPVLKKVKCPTLVLNGSNDLQVPAHENLFAIRKAFAESGNKKLTAIELEGLNHLFQESKTGLPAEYGEIEQTFSPKALKEILKWIKKQ